MRDLEEFIIDKTIKSNTVVPKTILKKLKKVNYSNNYILCCDSYGYMYKTCPTLTFSGCKYMFHSTYNRYLSCQECLMLQGFPVNFKNVVGDVKLCNQIGNSMSVNVLKVLFQKIFDITTFA